MKHREFSSIDVFWGLAVALVVGCGGGGETTGAPAAGHSFNQRLAEIEAVSSPLLKARQLREFAKNQYKAKNLTGADDVFREALSVCAKIESPSDRAVELAFLSGAMVETDDSSGGAKKALAAAAASLDKIADPASKVDAMSVVAKANGAMDNKTAAVGLLRDAEKLIDSIQADGNQELAREEKSQALLAIASAYKFLQRPDDMNKVIEQSLDIAKSIGDARGRCDAIANVGQGLKRMRLDGGDAAFDLAIENARQIEDPLSQGHALAEIAIKLTEAREPAKASKVLDEAAKLSEKVTDMGLRRELDDKIRKARS